MLQFKVNIEVIDIPRVFEVLPMVLEVEKKTLVLVYMSNHLDSFIDDFILLISELPRQQISQNMFLTLWRYDITLEKIFKYTIVKYIAYASHYT